MQATAIQAEQKFATASAPICLPWRLPTSWSAEVTPSLDARVRHFWHELAILPTSAPSFAEIAARCQVAWCRCDFGLQHRPDGSATMQCAHGYPGARRSRRRPRGTRSVGRAVEIALRIAVTGRQKLYWYLASNTASSASSAACATAASNRAFWVTSRPGTLAIDSTIP